MPLRNCSLLAVAVMLLEWAGVWPAVPIHVALPDRQWLAG